MILLGNGKSSWYQWDINQRIIITDIEIDQIEGQEIHFSSDVDTDTTAQVTIPYVENGIVYAPVPNILLTISGTIHIYLYVSNGTEAHTEVHKAVKVVAREKPSDYVYTETEVKTWEELNERLKNAVYYTPEERTEEEKAQARENIGVPQSDYTQNDATKPDFIKNRPGGYFGEQKTYKLDITGVKQDGIDELTEVSVLQDDFIHTSSINVEISHYSGTINRTLTQREIGQYIINMSGAQIYGNANLIDARLTDTGEDVAMYKEMDSQSNYSIGWHVWATSVPSGDVEVCVVEKTMNAVPFDPVFIPWETSPTAKSVLYTEQSLTEAQQAQARNNIGVRIPFVVTISKDSNGNITADKTFSEIKEAHDAGMTIYAAYKSTMYSLVGYSSDGIVSFALNDRYNYIAFTCESSGVEDFWNYYEEDLSSLDIYGASAGQVVKVKSVDENGLPTEWKAEKDTTPFIVTVGGTASSGYTSSHTFDEIVAAASAGRVVMAYTDYIHFPQVGQSLYGVYFNLDSTQDVAIFVYIDPWNMIKYTFAVDPFSISASASYLSATSSTFGGVKADSAEATDTQPVRIGGDGKLYTAPGGGGADISLGISGATAGQMAKVKAVNESGAPTAWEAGDAAGGYDIDLSREPDLVIDVTEDINPSISISEIDGVSIDASKMAVLLEYPSGAEYTPNYVRFNNVVKNSTDSSSALANANVQKFTNASTSGALLIKAHKINDGTYLLEYKYLMQNPGTITGYANTVYAMIYRNAIDGETSIKELYIYQAATIKAGSKISIWVG